MKIKLLTKYYATIRINRLIPWIDLLRAIRGLRKQNISEIYIKFKG